MPVTLNQLRAAGLASPRVAYRTLTEARSASARTVFLCHSHHDAALAKGLVNLLADAGWKAYIDWEDTEMPSTPNRATATKLQERIATLDLFLFLATANSLASRWCPWEIGYANGVKHIDSIIVCATADGSSTHGSEYLELYRRLDVTGAGALAVWRPREHQNGIFVRDL